MKKTVYTAEAVNTTVRNLTSHGASARTTYPDGIEAVIITKPGYKTLVFRYYGDNYDGNGGLYTLRKYNSTPAKYA
jgi:hypothetical protein